jgi:beta-mannanase
MGIEVDAPWAGLYLPDDFSAALRTARQYELFLGKRIRLLSFYVAWGAGNGRPDLAGIHQVIQNGFVPMITWEPWRPQMLPQYDRPADQPAFSLSAILSGRYDDYIRKWALDLKEIQNPIFFRPMHEMNGNWYPWCGNINGNKPAEYIETWRYIRSIFREVKNDRLTWVWSPYVHSVPEEPGNEMGQCFPGIHEVDWLGLDGYNWGTSREWSTWQSFQEIFQNGYDRLMQLAPGKSFMIAEAGCSEEGGDKGKWVEEAFEVLRNRFFRVKALVWFNVDKECDWRIESSPGSANSFKKNWSCC